MNRTLKLLTFTGLLAATAAQAQVNLYITGSTAFRPNAYLAIRTLYGSTLTSQNPPDPAGGKNQVTWTGQMPAVFGNQQVTVFTSWSGSISGIQALNQNSQVQFLASANPGDTNFVNVQADLAFSDVFQSASPYLTPALDDAKVAVQPFAYVKSLATPSSVTNVTIQQMQALLANGSMPLSYWSGNTNDDNTPVYLVGRDSGSGTRQTAERDALFVGQTLLYATTNGCDWVIIPGFTSTSYVAATLNSSCGAAIGYVGIADAATIANGANILAYNGYLPFVGPIVNPDWTPVREGLYSFWGYEHLFQRAGAPANIGSFRAALLAAIDAGIATSTTHSVIQVSTMRVSRNADGGPITPNF
ncbi:MAG: hypothetical protein KGS61_08995 [Verrucomicrobia bacterium]|nr:hypothetical protein [Verrucomicrobiota bacterium]